jgi:hypothetical protein
MQKSITITYQDGGQETYTAYPPDFAKWEKTTSKGISEFAGIWDILFVAHSAMKREKGGMPTKALDAWMESIIDVDVETDNPKVISKEALADS